MSALAEKLRKARETTVEVGGFKFRIRRPTDVEMMALRGEGSVARLFPYVIGWDGVREIDLIRGGDAVPVKFDETVRDEWLADRPDLVATLVEAIVGAYREHTDALEAAEKN